MTEKLIKAMIAKLRARIFMRYSPVYLAIEIQSEIVLRPQFDKSIGGLEYDVSRSGMRFRLIIIHIENDLFVLVLLPLDSNKRHGSVSLKTRFWILDRSIKTLVDCGVRDVERVNMGVKSP